MGGEKTQYENGEEMAANFHSTNTHTHTHTHISLQRNPEISVSNEKKGMLDPEEVIYMIKVRVVK